MSDCLKGQISLRITGGIIPYPRAAAGWTVALDDLPDVDVEKIRASVSDADFFSRPEPVASSNVRDGRLYSVSIEIDGRTRTLAIPDPFSDVTLVRLAQLVRCIVTR
jgi:hypothetical protein